jgi:hypothetical protein
VGTSYKEVENDELATPHREGVLPTTEKLHILFTQEWHQIGIPLYNNGSRHVTVHTPVLCRDFFDFERERANITNLQQCYGPALSLE